MRKVEGATRKGEGRGAVERTARAARRCFPLPPCDALHRGWPCDALHRGSAISCLIPQSAIRNPQSEISPFRLGLTLIELLVVIVILTTLVAGVIPVLSPNNDVRKIREASRSLQTYITMAQAEAARTGRPHGVAFRETAPGSGVALDVFQLEVPPPFAGFSTASTAIFRVTNTANFEYEIQLGEGKGTSFVSNTGPYVPEKMTRPGDIIEIGGARFRLDKEGTATSETTVGGVTYFLAKSLYSKAVLINSSRSSMSFNFNFSSGSFSWSSPKPYKIIRQPTNSAESPLQLPLGIAIDLQGSGIEGEAGGLLNTPSMTPPGSATVFNAFDANEVDSTGNPIADNVGIMFSPTGAIGSVYFNGNKLVNLSRVFLLLGRVENGNPDSADYDFLNSNGLISNDVLEQRRKKVNWLDLDSRWLMIAARSGRTIVSENAFVDPRLPALIDNDPDQAIRAAKSAKLQIEAAHLFAHEMQRGGGG